MFMFNRVLVGLFFLFTLVHYAYANTAVEFYYVNWEMVCDNTLTCRVAGFGRELDDGDSHISILLERKAGANQPITGGYFKYESYKYEDDDKKEQILKNHPISLVINNKDLGTLIKKPNSIYQLKPHQLSALLRVLKKTDNEIFFKQGDRYWELFDIGYNAVMLKMDEVQGRIGTIGAIIKSGKKSENDVYKPIPAPVIKKGTVIKSDESKKLTLDEVIAIFPEFKTRYSDEKEADCFSYDLDEKEEDNFKPHFYLYKLDKNNDLLKASCLRGAYNFSDAYWVIPKKKINNNKIEFVVTNVFPEYNNGVIKSDRKMRGLGDCWIYEELTWNGRKFVPSAKNTTGSCNGFLGGTWRLPILVTRVVTK